MVLLGQLWLPIILSAVLVFVSSSLIHMLLKWHASDYRRLPNEDDVRAAIRKDSPQPGQYVIPYCAEMKDMGSEAMQKKYAEGPIGFLVLKANGAPSMVGGLAGWFIYSVVVAFFVAYIAAHTLAPGAHQYLKVFRVVGAVTFLAYAGGAAPAAIWMGKPWGSALKDMLDGLIYGLVTAGTFGWLWPR